MPTKSSFINRVLGSVGFELRKPGRKMSDLMQMSPSPTSGWLLEFIGTQGIGKTTLNNAVYRHFRANWFLRSDLGQTGPAENSAEHLEALHQKLFFNKFERLKTENPDAWRTITVARQMSKVAGESLTMLSNTFPRGFVLDESLFKNFPHEVLKLSPEESAPIWNKRAFIHLRARDPDFVVARYQSRVAERARKGLLQMRPTDEHVRTRIETDNALFDEICAKAETFGCPVLTVYAEDDQTDNVGKIIEFEKSLHSRVA